MSEQDCCHDSHLDDARVRAAAEEVERTNRIARRIEAVLVALCAAAFVATAAAGIMSVRRLAHVAESTKDLVARQEAEERQRDAEARAEMQRRAEAAAAGDRLASDAVLCIVGELRAHRVADRTIHDRIVATLGTSYKLAPNVGDVEVPTLAFKEACDRFEAVVHNGGSPP